MLLCHPPPHFFVFGPCNRFTLRLGWAIFWGRFIGTLLLMVCLALGLGGCAGPGSHGASAKREVQCQTEIEAIADVALLQSHMPIYLKDTRTAAMLQDTARPDARQRKAIMRLDQVKQVCQRRTMVALTERGTPAQMLAVLDESGRAGHALRLQLAQSAMSFGEFNRRAETLDARTKQALDQAQQRAAPALKPVPKPAGA